jgi:hypothetical protein
MRIHPGWKKFGSGNQDGKIGIRDKHPWIRIRVQKMEPDLDQGGKITLNLKKVNKNIIKIGL